MSAEPTPPCNPHPDAPHGFDRNASHTADRYVCDCEGWQPTDFSSPEGQRAPCPEAGNDGDALACPPSGGDNRFESATINEDRSILTLRTSQPAPPEDPVEWNAEKWHDIIINDPLKAISAANHLAIECNELKEDVANLRAQLDAKPASPEDDPAELPTCGCDEMWPGKGHNPKCPVMRAFIKLSYHCRAAEKLVLIAAKDARDTARQRNKMMEQLVAAETKAAEQGRHAVSIFDECKKLQGQLAAAQAEESRLRTIVNETYKLLYPTFDHDEGNNGLPKAVNALILERDAAQARVAELEDFIRQIPST